MKILVINGFANTKQGKSSFEVYQKIIRKFFTELGESVDTEIDFIVRDRDSIWDYLFEVDSKHAKFECAKNFDQADIIFFDGDPQILPWAPQVQNVKNFCKLKEKLICFLRMCLRTNKILFASGFAMQALVFLIATNTEKSVKIINGINGGSIGDLSKFDLSDQNISHNEFFLENVTGDLYRFNYETNEWVTKANVGIHQRMAAEQFKTVGKYIIKAPVYKSPHLNVHFFKFKFFFKKKKKSEQMLVSNLYENICSIKKINIQNYLFQGLLSQDFIIPFRNTWDIHPFNFVNPRKTFTTLSETTKGPCLIQINDNIVASVFNIDPKYPETVKILKNFITQQLQRICSNRTGQLRLQQVDQFMKDNMNEKNSLQQIYTKNAKYNIQTDFHHVGFSTRKQETLTIVLNNAISSKRIKRVSESQPKIQKINLNRELENRLITKSKTFGKKSHRKRSMSFGIKLESISPSKNKHQATLNTQNQNIDDVLDQQLQITKSDIRLFLHPYIDANAVPKRERLWVPGKNQLGDLIGQIKKLC